MERCLPPVGGPPLSQVVTVGRPGQFGWASVRRPPWTGLRDQRRPSQQAARLRRCLGPADTESTSDVPQSATRLASGMSCMRHQCTEFIDGAPQSRRRSVACSPERACALTRTCAQCGRSFVPAARRGRPPKLCGAACRVDWKRAWSHEHHRTKQARLLAERGPRACATCGADLSRLRVSARWCSPACRLRVRTQGRPTAH